MPQRTRRADRRMSLYTHSLLFCCPDELVAIDCIPTYQVRLRVRACARVCVCA